MHPCGPGARAAAMLGDLLHKGVDEDLLSLKAQWGVPFRGKRQSPLPTPPLLLADARAAAPSPSASPPVSPPGWRRASRAGAESRRRLRLLNALRAAAAAPGVRLLQGPPAAGSRPAGAIRADAVLSAKFGAPIVRASRRAAAPAAACADDDEWVRWERRWEEELDSLLGRGHAPAPPPPTPQTPPGFSSPRQRPSPFSFRQPAGGWRETPERFARTYPRKEGSRSSDSSCGGSSYGSRPRASRPSAGTTPAATPSPAPARTWASWAEYDAAFTKWEAASDGVLRADAVPWPSSLSSVSGVDAADSAGAKKKKLFAALRRWHPDRWAGLLGRAPEGRDRQLLAERVKEVTQRILREKELWS
eukprot:TRINITY_DN24471_c0_g1_i1.p1 TRINITY_DN24471_c0_g1~~TRINITY_DN24471_c0_g1_i1.p1  ORF type:complete len:361 (+),score=113.18 TRINITY_DN24471_c0_g1_i1:57-1139(+)